MESKYGKFGYLSEIDLFQGLSSKELEEVEGKTSMKHYPKGNIFYRPGEHGEILFILKKGKVRIYKISPEGKQLTLAILDVGTIFGEMLLVGQGMYDAYAQALEDSTLCVMNKQDIQNLLLARPKVGLKLIEIMGQRLKESEKRLEGLAFKSVSARLATLLLRLARKRVNYPGRMRIPSRFTHQQLAEMIGTSRETLTRELNKLKARDLVSVDHKKIELLDPSGLEKISVE